MVEENYPKRVESRLEIFSGRYVNDFPFQVFRQSFPEAGDVSCSQITLQVADPVYGSRLVNNFEYFLPPFFLITIFVVTMAKTLDFVIGDIAGVISLKFAFLGVKFYDELISYLFELLYILVVHAAFAFVLLLFSIWNDLLPMEGSLTLVIALIFMEGLCGMAAALSLCSINIVLILTLRWFSFCIRPHSSGIFFYLIGKHPSLYWYWFYYPHYQ